MVRVHRAQAPHQRFESARTRHQGDPLVVVVLDAHPSTRRHPFGDARQLQLGLRHEAPEPTSVDRIEGVGRELDLLQRTEPCFHLRAARTTHFIAKLLEPCRRRIERQHASLRADASRQVDGDEPRSGAQFQHARARSQIEGIEALARPIRPRCVLAAQARELGFVDMQGIRG
jgi:hypothetical protein